MAYWTTSLALSILCWFPDATINMKPATISMITAIDPMILVAKFRSRRMNFTIGLSVDSVSPGFIPELKYS